MEVVHDVAAIVIELRVRDLNSVNIQVGVVDGEGSTVWLGGNVEAKADEGQHKLHIWHGGELGIGETHIRGGNGRVIVVAVASVVTTSPTQLATVADVTQWKAASHSCTTCIFHNHGCADPLSYGPAAFVIRAGQLSSFPRSQCPAKS